jgi:hypothetical protein
MLGWLLVFPRECPFQLALNFHVLSHLLKLKPYCIAYSDTFFRYHYSFILLLFCFAFDFYLGGVWYGVKKWG